MWTDTFHVAGHKPGASTHAWHVYMYFEGGAYFWPCHQGRRHHLCLCLISGSLSALATPSSGSISNLGEMTPSWLCLQGEDQLILCRVWGGLNLDHVTNGRGNSLLPALLAKWLLAMSSWVGGKSSKLASSLSSRKWLNLGGRWKGEWLSLLSYQMEWLYLGHVFKGCFIKDSSSILAMSSGWGAAQLSLPKHVTKDRFKSSKLVSSLSSGKWYNLGGIMRGRALFWQCFIMGWRPWLQEKSWLEPIPN